MNTDRNGHTHTACWSTLSVILLTTASISFAWSTEAMHLCLALLHRRMIGSSMCIADTEMWFCYPEFKKKKSAGSVPSKHYRSPVNFAFCIQDHVLIDISECDLYLMLIWSTHYEKVHACKLKSLETITFRAYKQLIKALFHSSKV